MATEPYKSPLVDLLAWQIWSAKGVAVPVADAEVRSGLDPALRSGVLIEDECGLKFSDQSVMIEAAARHLVSSELIDLTGSSQRCFERLYVVWAEEIGKESVSGRALALLHNSGHIDAFFSGQLAIEAGSDVFNVLEVFDGAIPHFSDGLPKSIISFFSGHYEKVKNDLAGGMLFSKFDQWLSTHPQIAQEVRKLHMENRQESSAGIFRSALQGLVLNDFNIGIKIVVEAARSEDPLVSRPAIHALGLIDFSDPSRSSALAEAIEICRCVIERPSHPALATAVRTLGWLVVFDEKIASLLDQPILTGDPEALYAISSFLFQKAKTYHERVWFKSLLQSFGNVKPQHKGILRNIDMILMDWIQVDPRQRETIAFLDTWVSNQNKKDLQEGSIETVFPSTVAKLAQQPHLLRLTLTAWFLKDDSRFPLVAYKMISHLRVASSGSLYLDRSILDGLGANELRFLVRRLLGYLTGDGILIPLVFSLVYTRNAAQRTLGLVEQVLVNQIGYDYTFRTIEYLKIQQNLPDIGEDIRTLCGRIISKLEFQLDALRELPNLKELHPPSSKVRRFQKERHRQMNEAFEEARKDSIFSQLATHIQLKAGIRSFQLLGDRYTDPMELKTISHSAVLPSSAITDPAGEARERQLFRMAKREDP